MSVGTGNRAPFAIPARERERLRALLETAVARARHDGSCLAAITWRCEDSCDPSAVVSASRRPGEPWFCLEQPERGIALGALGSATVLEATGEQRFATVAAHWRRLIATAATGRHDGPAGSGPVACGGFAFAPHGGAAPHWAGYAPASLVVPEISLLRAGGETWISAQALATSDDLPDELLSQTAARLGELRAVSLPLLDPSPVGHHSVSSAAPPEHYEAAVARAVELIARGALEKVVLAREVQVHAPAPHDAAAILGVLRDAFRACSVFCVGRGSSGFVGASPELLVRREGMRASTLALAGSARRSADPAVDDHLGEQLLRSEKDRSEHAIVARRIERALRPHAVWVTMAPEPTLARIANIQHLATPIRAQLADPIGVIDLAGLLHPTPAVGGEPFDVAAPLIPALEGLDRGWYAGPIGYADANEDGEFCVALRCALLDERLARCYAGVGVVAGSEPAAELAETELKLQALLPVLAA